MTCEYCKNQTATYCEHCLPDYLRNSTNRPQTLEEFDEDAKRIIKVVAEDCDGKLGH